MFPAADPDSTLDYLFDWTLWLQEGETITLAAVTVKPTTVVIGTAQIVNDGKAVLVWRTAAVGAGKYVSLRCTITTSDARKDVRSARVPIDNR